jgi:hypothetical protein
LLSFWDEFTELDFDKILKSMTKGKKTIFNGDDRNKLEIAKLERMGFLYFTVGKRTKSYRYISDSVSAVLRNGK